MKYSKEIENIKTQNFYLTQSLIQEESAKANFALADPFLLRLKDLK